VSAEAEKAAWRSRLLAERKRLSSVQLATAARSLKADLIMRLGGLAQVAAYVPVGAEPGSVDLLDALHERGTVVLLPVVRPNGQLWWAPYGGPHSLVAGPWGLREPATDRLAPRGKPMTPNDQTGSTSHVPGANARRRVTPRSAEAGSVEPNPLEHVDAIVVPALAVDHRGTRLGRGAGYYDRALARVPRRAPIVALLHDGELVERLPADPWDRPVTAAVTPADGWTNLPLMPHHSD
jgi:5-formyltetrahydrofolate cyclo-ligase